MVGNAKPNHVIKKKIRIQVEFDNPVIDELNQGIRLKEYGATEGQQVATGEYNRNRLFHRSEIVSPAEDIIQHVWHTQSNIPGFGPIVYTCTNVGSCFYDVLTEIRVGLIKIKP